MTKDSAPDTAMADQGGIIQGNTAFLQTVEKSADVLPVDIHPILFLRVLLLFLEIGITERKHGKTTIPGNFCGNPLPDFTLRLGVDQQLNIRVAVRVDKSRRNGQTGSFDDGFRPVPVQMASDLINFIVLDGNIQQLSRVSPSVINGTARNQDVNVFIHGTSPVYRSTAQAMA